MVSNCIPYEGTRNAKGYGVLPTPVYGTRLAHRAALAELLGRPVEGVTRHECDNPPCINPEHLSEGSQAENVNDACERGRMKGGRKDQTHCIHGHELSDENVTTYERASTRSTIQARRCMTCRRENNKKQAQRRKEARHARGLLKQGRPSIGK